MTDKIVVEFIPAKKWYRQATWRLTKSYTSANKEVRVPEGFITDGASIPWIFRKFFSTTGAYFGASIVHDYVLVKDRDWNNANHQFWAELTALGIKSWRKALLLTAVRLYYRWLRLTGRD